jgi:hypothetical protein
MRRVGEHLAECPDGQAVAEEVPGDVRAWNDAAVGGCDLRRGVDARTSTPRGTLLALCTLAVVSAVVTCCGAADEPPTCVGRPAGLLKIVEAARLHGHSDPVTAVVVSPDGRRLLSASVDRTMILWDRDRGQMLRRFRERGGWINSVAISPDGRRALSGGEDGVIRLWDLDSGDMLREFRGHTDWVLCVAFSPDGRLAYSTSGGRYTGVWQDGTDSAIRVWDVETGREVRKLEGHEGMVWSVAVSPDGRRVLSGGHDRIPILWDAETGAVIRRFQGHTDRVICVAFLPEGRRFVSCGYDRTVRLWDLETGREIHCFRGHRIETDWLAVSPDGHWLMSADYLGRELRLWDVEARKPVDRVNWGCVNPTRGQFTPDGRQVVWGDQDGSVRVYRLAHCVGSAPSDCAVTPPAGSEVASRTVVVGPAVALLCIVTLIVLILYREASLVSQPESWGLRQNSWAGKSAWKGEKQCIV